MLHVKNRLNYPLQQSFLVTFSRCIYKGIVSNFVCSVSGSNSHVLDVVCTCRKEIIKKKRKGNLLNGGALINKVNQNEYHMKTSLPSQLHAFRL